MFIFMFENRSLDELQLEKKHLHEYLKVYERCVANLFSFLYKLKSVFIIMFFYCYLYSDFNRTHGRPVMKNEDILPVAAEYQRYKELKNLIKDLKQ